MTTWTNTPRTWAATETITAALLNAQLRDPLIALGGAWNSYTPTLAQGASTDISKTVTRAAYLQFGKLLIVQLSLAVTAAGTAGSAITATLPVTAAGSGYIVGSGMYYDTGSAFYPALASLNSATKVALYRTDAGYSGAIGADPNIAVASGDSFQAFMVYEAA